MRKIDRHREAAASDEIEPNSADIVTPAKAGGLELGVPGDQYFWLSAFGFAGILPTTVWLMSPRMLFPPSGLDTSPSSGVDDSALMMALGILATFFLLAIPASVPSRILRARQKLGAKLKWDNEGVTEWDGVWRRNAIPWSRMEVAHFTWAIMGRSGSKFQQDVVQLFDTSSNAVISAWQSTPRGTPVVRRRVASDDVPKLVEVLRARNIPFSRAVDYSLAEDPERKRMHGFSLAIARLGYVGAVMGPMIALPAPLPGVAISVIAAALLAWRALPVFREHRVVSARMRDDVESNEMPSNAGDPYREASKPTVAQDPRGRYEADKIKRRAIRYEATMRGAFVVLTLFAGIAMAMHPN